VVRRVTVSVSDQHDAFTSFVEIRGRQLGRLCWGLTGSRSKAEDLAQATLERLWPRWQRVEQAGDPWAYTCKIAVSIHSSWLRRASSRTEVPGEVDRDLPSDVPDPTLRLDIERWLRQLGRRQRTVIVLRFLMDMSVEDAAETMSCSTGTVKSQTARALNRLRKIADEV